MPPEVFFNHIRSLPPQPRLITLAAAVSLAHSPREAAPFAYQLLDLARTSPQNPRLTISSFLQGLLSHQPPIQHTPITEAHSAQALATILSHWHLMPDDLRSDLTKHLADTVKLLPAAIELLVHDTQAGVQSAHVKSLALALKDLDHSPYFEEDESSHARSHLDAALLRLLGPTIDPGVRETASQTAFSFIHNATTKHLSQSTQLGSLQTEFFFQVLDKAHTNILKPLIELALLAFSAPQTPPVLQTQYAAQLASLAQHNDPLRRALCSVISWSKVPCVSLWATRFLIYPHLATAAARRIHAFSNQPLATRIQALSKIHLLLRPARQQALEIKGREKAAATKHVSDTPTVPFTIGEVRALPATAKSMLGSLLSHVAVPAPVKAPLLRVLLTDPATEARYAAMLASPTESLPDWCFDPHPAIARSATLRYLDLSKSPNPAFLTSLSQSPHAAVAALATVALFQSTPITTNPKAPSQVSTLSTLPSPSQLLSTSTRDPAAAASMLTAIHQAGCASEYVQPLLTIAKAQDSLTIRSQDPASSRLQATAISLLGEVKAIASFDRVQCLASWIEHDTLPIDPRATANAIDAIDRMSRRGEPIPAQTKSRICEVASNSNHPLAQSHRIRASAIRASISCIEPHHADSGSSNQLDFALNNAVSMLTDSRPGHAIAGAWLAGMLGRTNARLKDRAHQQPGQLSQEPAHATRIQSLLTNLAQAPGPSQLRLRASVSLLQWQHLAPPSAPLKLNMSDVEAPQIGCPTAYAA